MQTSLLALALQLPVKSSMFFLVLSRMGLFPKEKHLCHTSKNYTQFFTSLGLHFPMLTNWYLGECYYTFCLPSMHRQLEFKINPVKFQESMITFSFLVLNMLVVAQFILFYILSVFCVFPLIFLPPPSGSFHLLAGIQQK